MPKSNLLRRFAKSREFTAIAFIVLLFLGVGLYKPNFLSLQNIMLCLNGSVVYTVAALGIALVIICGEIDVSVGATLGMAAAVSATMIRDGQPWALAIAAALGVGVLVGLVNGLGVAVVGIPSIICTLGVNGIVRGLIYVYSNGKWIENLPFAFKALAQGGVGELTYFYLFALVAMALLHLCLRRTRRGRYLAATGDNVGGAVLLGIPVVATKVISFVACSVFAAIGGLLYVSRVGFVTPIAGNGYEMKVIAACVLGGISLSGGVGSMLGAAVGAAIMASISRVLVFLDFPTDYDNTITGILLITVVVADALLQRRAAEQARRLRLNAKTAARMGGGEKGGERLA
ncbi:MAG: ABC transporter permease [Oscillospiraceae bacterium]|nr:ABC transporter permease [Oscillospiraceae bacterium]